MRRAPATVSCGVCGRGFTRDRVELHEEICRRAAEQRRAVFNSVKQRTGEIVAEMRGVRISRKNVKTEDWRSKRAEFLRQARNARATFSFDHEPVLFFNDSENIPPESAVSKNALEATMLLSPAAEPLVDPAHTTAHTTAHATADCPPLPLRNWSVVHFRVVYDQGKDYPVLFEKVKEPAEPSTVVVSEATRAAGGSAWVVEWSPPKSKTHVIRSKPTNHVIVRGKMNTSSVETPRLPETRMISPPSSLPSSSPVSAFSFASSSSLRSDPAFGPARPFLLKPN